MKSNHFCIYEFAETCALNRLPNGILYIGLQAFSSTAWSKPKGPLPRLPEFPETPKMESFARVVNGCVLPLGS